MTNKNLEDIKLKIIQNWVTFPNTSYDEEAAREEVFHDDSIEDYSFYDSDVDWLAWESPYGDRFWLESGGRNFMFYVYDLEDWHRKKEILTFVGHEHNVEINLKEHTIKKYGTR